jgi:hypothetical protein
MSTPLAERTDGLQALADNRWHHIQVLGKFAGMVPGMKTHIRIAVEPTNLRLPATTTEHAVRAGLIALGRHLSAPFGEVFIGRLYSHKPDEAGTIPVFIKEVDTNAVDPAYCITHMPSIQGAEAGDQPLQYVDF